MSACTSEDTIAGLRSLTLDKEEDDIPQQVKTLGDLPPEVMTKILEWLTGRETRNNVLSYRLVNRQWKDILGDLIEKKLESGRLEPFPAMTIREESTELLEVRCFPSLFRADGNPFLFNSVLLSGNAELNFMPENNTDIQMDLPVFISEFGGNLTSLALHDQKIPVSTLVAMIGSLPRLKRLSLMNVLPEDSAIKPDAVLPTPPPLPNLAVLDVKLAPLNDREGYLVKKRNMLYIWLIASYADQLVRLNLATDDPFPPLRIQHQYSISLPNDKLFLVGTTSESAFGNLKELNVLSPSSKFLIASETPALQQLSVSGLYYNFDLRQLLLFCVKCGDTLEKLNVDVRFRWSYLQMSEVLYDGQLQPTEGTIIPKLKTLTIHYPSEDSSELMLNKELLVMVPALEVLYLLHFRPLYFDDENPCGGGNEAGGADDDIVALKERCALLCKEVADSHRDIDHLRCWMGADPPRNEWERMELDIFRDEMREADYYKQELKLCRDMSPVKAERNEVFRRLAALGETREKVMVEQLLERREIWNTCPNLKIVTVSSGSTPDGDLCRVRKPNDA